MEVSGGHRLGSGRVRGFPVMLAVFLCAAICSHGAAQHARWRSLATGQELSFDIAAPAGSANPLEVPVVLYLKGLASGRRGTEDDATITSDFKAAGYLVVSLDYQGHPRSRVPYLNRDLSSLRDDLRAKRILTDWKIDSARVFIVPAGCRLLRDVVYYHDEDRALAMDVVYPSKPKERSGAVIQFSCDNLNRMGNTSLSICSDTLLDAAATEGFAAAMADHPVAAPYKGIDPMPESAWKIKAAVRTLRSMSQALEFNGRIVPVGFSRGSGMALMLVTTAGMNDFESRGEHSEERSSVEGAVVLSGRFTYLDLLPNDQMIPRYVRAWGERDAPGDIWRKQGALDYLANAPGAPLFLSINSSEGPDALYQMKVLRQRLAELGADGVFLMEREPRGHKVPLDPEVLGPMYHYLAARLR